MITKKSLMRKLRKKGQHGIIFLGIRLRPRGKSFVTVGTPQSHVWTAAQMIGSTVWLSEQLGIHTDVILSAK